jgi:rod shape-determining protein MreC
MELLMGRYRNVSILAAAIFLQIVGLAVQVKRSAENRSTRLIRVWSVAAVTPLEKNIVRLQNGVSSIWNNYLYLRGVRQQNRELQQQIQQLQLEQVRLRQDAEQAHRLQALLGFKEQFIDKTTAAQVIGSSGSEQSHIVYLDKGSSDGIAADMAVISAQGIVGKVIQVFRHTSQVLLINDQSSGVGTILEQSRLQGVLKGRTSGALVLDKIMAEEEVKAGDRVLTSGGDQIFPKGLPVGTVASVSRGPEFLSVTIRPAASLDHLEEVLVITKKQEREPAVRSAEPLRAADILAQRLPSVPDKVEPPTKGTALSTKPGQGTIETRPLAVAGTNVSSGGGDSAAQLAPKPGSQAVDLARAGSEPSKQTATGMPKPSVSAGTTTSANSTEAKAGPVTAPPKPPNPANGAVKNSPGTPTSNATRADQVATPKKAATPTMQPQPLKPAQPTNPTVTTSPTSTSGPGDTPQ